LDDGLVEDILGRECPLQTFSADARSLSAPCFLGFVMPEAEPLCLYAYEDDDDDYDDACYSSEGLNLLDLGALDSTCLRVTGAGLKTEELRDMCVKSGRRKGFVAYTSSLGLVPEARERMGWGSKPASSTQTICEPSARQTSRICKQCGTDSYLGKGVCLSCNPLAPPAMMSAGVDRSQARAHNRHDSRQSRPLRRCHRCGTNSYQGAGVCLHCNRARR